MSYLTVFTIKVKPCVQKKIIIFRKLFMPDVSERPTVLLLPRTVFRQFHRKEGALCSAR